MFQYDSETSTVRDLQTGERLTFSGHYQDPLRYARIVDQSGQDVFLCSYRCIFGDFDDNNRGTIEYVFVSGTVAVRPWQPDRSDAACLPYFERIGNHLVETSLSKSNVRHASWRIDRRVRHWPS